MVVTIVSLIFGWKSFEIFILFNPEGKTLGKSKEYPSFCWRLYQKWNHFICFFIGGGGIGFYFWKIRWPQISKDGNISVADFVLLLFFLMSLMGLTPYALTNLTKSIVEIIQKAVGKTMK